MKEFTTKNGTKLYYKVNYDLGSFNYFTETKSPRGYYISIRRDPRRMRGFEDITNEYGSVNLFVKSVKRKSQKALEEVEANAEDSLKTFLANNFPNL